MIRYLLDTCVVSDLSKDRPAPSVIEWANARSLGETALSVLTLGEIRRGIELLPAGRRRDKLWDWLEHSLPEQYTGRILPIDGAMAQAWGVLSARATREKRNLPTVDGLLLATAHVHGLAIVTRNVRDFSGYDVTIVNPWDSDD